MRALALVLALATGCAHTQTQRSSHDIPDLLPGLLVTAVLTAGAAYLAVKATDTRDAPAPMPAPMPSDPFGH